MKIENSFLVNLPLPDAWRTLLDIPSIVHCMPGATLLAVEDDRTYKGQVKAKLGPVAVTFQGRAQFVDVDEASRTVRVKASGNEMQGRGNASADVAFKLTEAGANTRVDIVTDVNLAGAVAQYGRAQGVIAGVAQVLIDQFAANLRQHLDAIRPVEPVLAGAAPSSPPAPKAAASEISALGLFLAYLRGRLSNLLGVSR
ncbi:MAG TPA: SRPBCC family protein [Beijerinckiaceae bacterium]|nr:SRPBCC family protein [Beijerinckiaceae bacterium]